MLRLGVNLSSDPKISQRLIFKDGLHVGQLIGTSLYIQVLPVDGPPLSATIQKDGRFARNAYHAYADVLMEFENRLEAAI